MSPVAWSEVVAASLPLLHAIHVDAAQETTDFDVLTARIRVGFEDVAHVARHNPTAAGHLARAIHGVIAAREYEIRSMRTDQYLAMQQLAAARRTFRAPRLALVAGGAR